MTKSSPADPLTFVSVYRTKGHEQLLYSLLRERPKFMNISHLQFPSFEAHRRFVKSKPYKEWLFIRSAQGVLGSIYLSYLDEIGFFLFKPFRHTGREREVLEVFISQRKKLRLLANVSLKNKFYQKIFKSMGFKHIQNTYCLDRR